MAPLGRGDGIVETSTDPNDRLTAFGRELIEVHDWLRGELDRLSDDADMFLEDAGLEGAGPPPLELRAHCLTFCTA